MKITKSAYHVLIGRLGGKKTLQNKGKKYFSKIGKVGAKKKLLLKKTKEQASK